MNNYLLRHNLTIWYFYSILCYQNS